MSTRKLGIDPEHRFYTRSDGPVCTEVTDAERVELAIAALTHGGDDRHLPDVEAYSIPGVYDATYNALFHLAILRAALARDAAAKEAEGEKAAKVNRLAEELYRVRYGNDSLTLKSLVCSDADGWRAVAQYVMNDATPGGAQ